MTKEEFKKIRVGDILLSGHNFVQIMSKHEDDEHFDGLLYTPYPLNIPPQYIKGLCFTEVDFFNIPSETFIADCAINGIEITDYEKDSFTINGRIDVVCRLGTVKYFSIMDKEISFIKSVVRKYKQIK